MVGKTQKTEPDQAMGKDELFAKLNASAEKTLNALMKAYEAGAKKGLEKHEEDQLIEILRRVKALRDEVQRITTEHSAVE